MGRKSKEQLAYEELSPTEQLVVRMEKIEHQQENMNRVNISQRNKTNNYLHFIAKVLLANHDITNKHRVVNGDYQKGLEKELEFIRSRG